MITYLKGDATEPVGWGNKIIVHICNDSGMWGAGFVLAISKKWSHVKSYYQSTAKLPDFGLGKTYFIDVENNLSIANMIAQGKTVYEGSRRVDYVALETCLIYVNKVAEYSQATIHMPYIGTGIGGGNWKVIEGIINKCMSNIDVYVYEFEQE